MGRLHGGRRAGRSRRDDFAGQFIQVMAAAAGVVAGERAGRRGHRPASSASWLVGSTPAASGSRPVRQNGPTTTTTAPRRRRVGIPGLLPRTVQLCIHCRQRPAGFWVSRHGGQTVRRPWCLSCCHGLDQAHHDMIPFES